MDIDIFSSLSGPPSPVSHEADLLGLSSNSPSAPKQQQQTTESFDLIGGLSSSSLNDAPSTQQQPTNDDPFGLFGSSTLTNQQPASTTASQGTFDPFASFTSSAPVAQPIKVAAPTKPKSNSDASQVSAFMIIVDSS